MKTVYTERLVLRQYIKCEADRDALVSLLTDADVMKNVGEGVDSQEKANEMFNRIFTSVYETSAFDIWSVFTRENSQYVAHAEIKPRKGTNDWEIIYILKKEHWGKGYATEIARALVEYGFEERKLSSVIATVDTENKNSIHVLEKIGMSLDRTERDERGEFHVYSINKSE